MTGSPGQPDSQAAPYDQDLEYALLGAVLLAGHYGDEAQVDRLLDDFPTEALYLRRSRDLWQAFIEARSLGQLTDPLNMTRYQTAFGREDLAALVESVVAPSVAEGYKDGLLDMANRRRALQAANLIQSAALNGGDFSDGVAAAQDVMHGAFACRAGAEPSDPMKAVAAVLRGGGAEGARPGLSWGIGSLDRSAGRITPDSLVVVAGRPGSGKTSWSMWWAQQTALHASRPVWVYAWEQSAEELWLLAAAQRSGVARRGDGSAYTADESGRIEVAARELGSLLRIHARGEESESSPTNVYALSRGIETALRKARPVPAAIVIDRLGLLWTRKSDDSEYTRLSNAIARLRDLSRAAGVPVWCVHQLNREVARAGTRPPRLDDLRGSGQIEEYASHVAFLHWGRDGRRIIVAKSRTGRPDECAVTLSGATGRVLAVASLGGDERPRGP